jgi:hypothetical protein
MVTTHIPVPLQAPLQPANVEFVPAVGVSVTMVPLAKFAEQALGQLIPEGLLTTVPLPFPASVTVSVKFDVVVLKVAVTFWAWLIVTVHVPVTFVQAPLQPAKVEPVAGVAVSVTDVPEL